LPARVSPPQPTCPAAYTHPPPFFVLRGPACRCLRRHRALKRAACDSSPRLRLSPLPCLNLPFEALPPRVSPPQPTCRAACTHPPPFPVLRGPVSRCPAPSRRIPASACDSSPRLRSSPLPCLNLLAATVSARMPRHNHNLLRTAHPQPHFLHVFGLLLALPIAISSPLCAALHIAPWVTILQGAPA